LNNVYIYILVAASVIYLIRALPMTLIRKNIKNPFLRSFLYYVPYVTLSVMTFPAILFETAFFYSALVGFVVAVVIAYYTGNLFKVVIGGCVSVFVIEFIVKLIY